MKVELSWLYLLFDTYQVAFTSDAEKQGFSSQRVNVVTRVENNNRQLFDFDGFTIKSGLHNNPTVASDRILIAQK